MKMEFCGEVLLNDLEPGPNDFGAEFLAGLRKNPKTLPCKFFYDEEGSKLFDQICELEEYYLTRTETKILRDNVREISSLCGSGSLLVELGSGQSSKTRLLLDHLDAPVAYVPIDISRAHLVRAAEALNGDYYPLEILPICADYNQDLTLPVPGRTSQKRLVFFPGSTIGNFEPVQAGQFLKRIGDWCEHGDGLLIGVDLRKKPKILDSAYNDSRGITAAFNLNLLHRANRELAAHFIIDRFRHRAFYDEAQGRIEMQLVSQTEQTVLIGTEKIHFGQGEFITTEYSYKYSPDSFRDLARSAGWSSERTWSDEDGLFSVHYFSRNIEETL